MRRPTTIATGSLLLIAAAGAGLLVYGTSSLSSRIRDNEASLARVLAAIRSEQGGFAAIQRFVELTERGEATTGLIYVIEDLAGRRNAVLNQRQFAGLGGRYRQLAAGRSKAEILTDLAADKIPRQGVIRELRVNSLRFGFSLAELNRQKRRLMVMGIIGLLVPLALGILLMTLSRHRDPVPPPSDEAREDDLGWIRPYLGAALEKRMKKGDDPLAIPIDERVVAVLAIGFPQLAGAQLQLQPQETLRQANDYLAPIIDALTEHGSAIVELEINRLVAVWGLVAEEKEPERAALQGAMAVFRAVTNEGRRQRAVGGEVLTPAIGLAAGRTIAGNIGSARRAHFTLIGGANDLARRIQLQAQSGELICNEAAFEKLRGVVEGEAAAPLFLEGLEEVLPLYRIRA